MESQQDKSLNNPKGEVQTDHADKAYGLIANAHVQVLCCCGSSCYESGSLIIIDNFIRVIA